MWQGIDFLGNGNITLVTSSRQWRNAGSLAHEKSLHLSSTANYSFDPSNDH